MMLGSKTLECLHVPVGIRLVQQEKLWYDIHRKY